MRFQNSLSGAKDSADREEIVLNSLASASQPSDRPIPVRVADFKKLRLFMILRLNDVL